MGLQTINLEPETTAPSKNKPLKHKTRINIHIMFDATHKKLKETSDDNTDRIT